MPPKIVLDTNCLFSAFLSPNYSREIIIFARKRKIILITTKILNADLSEVFHKKISINQLKVNRFLNKILATSQLVYPTKTILAIKRDPDDNRVLEAAIEGNCSYIVTRDKDLLELKTYKNIKIMNPKRFLDEFAP